ncbi:MAG TPA: thioredoxin domain-containing protein [Solirubrobacterales bacterium]|nr:thioredoxin domain-containing protein [Solirubrobacterales bacterium]
MSEVSSEVAARPLPRRGRFWIALVLLIGVAGLGYVIVEVATTEPGDELIHVEGINDAQRLFAGMPQEGDRLGSSDAPVTIQIFNDLQCSNCREDFMEAIPTLAEDYARTGDVQLLYRHYSNSENVHELGFYGAEAAAEQNYGWQYIYLFFASQEEAEKFGVNQNFLDTIAGGIADLDLPKWEADLEDKGGSDGEITRRLDGYEELGRNLGIRVKQAAIVSGPNGTITLQDGAGLAEIEKAIAEVE